MLTQPFLKVNSYLVLQALHKKHQFALGGAMAHRASTSVFHPPAPGSSPVMDTSREASNSQWAPIYWPSHGIWGLEPGNVARFDRWPLGMTCCSGAHVSSLLIRKDAGVARPRDPEGREL